MSTVITGKRDIAIYRLMVLKSALKLECLGMKHSRGSVFALIKREFGLKGNKENVLTQFTAYVEQVKSEQA